MMTLLRAWFVSVLMLVSVSAQATVENYGTLYAGTYQPASDFASLSVSGAGNVYTFTLTTFDLNALFTTNAFIGSMVVNTTPDVRANAVTISAVTGGGVTQVGKSNGGGPGGDWDFRFTLGQGAGDRLLANETITWTATFSSAVSIKDVALHVQGLTKAQGDSAWYTNSVPVTTPVPEPAAWALLLAGFGVLLAMQRRKAVNI
ncbi:PEP-CTERM sorting domain-containing protein [Methylophilus sp. QUAN]|uniref:PEP-CTERM sorting domain-containing protein n=1 Tax=Methylophilus sp. QUAN TaxID=2781020 RepID=UPI001E643891|nr:PEP-CTERM sorting domain-containing protein [Methylophilus sp. QUAN]